mgnify:CR=1 FL=1
MVEQNEKKIIVVINGKEREIQYWNDASTYDNQQESYDPIPDKIQNRSLHSFKKKRKKKSPVIAKKRKHIRVKQICISALSALGIGATFGFIMLTMFTGEQSIIDHAQGKETETTEVETSMTGEENLEIEVSVIQGGAFESMESATKAKETIQAAGYAAVVDDSEEPYRLYIGIGTKKEHLHPLISEYAANGDDIYAKELTIHPRGEMEEHELLIEGKQLLLAFMMDTERLFNEQTIDDRDTLSAKLSEWKAEVEREANENEAILDFAQSLQKTDDAIQTYLEKNHAEELWEAEQWMMEAFIRYKQIIR